VSSCPSCIFDFQKCPNLKCSRACSADDGETTIHSAFAESSPLKLKSIQPRIQRSPCSPQMAYFPEKPPLSLVNCSGAKPNILGHQNGTMKETTTDEVSHHSHILHSEHMHSCFQIVGGDVLDDGDNSTILSSEPTSSSRHRHTSMGGTETLELRHPLRRSIKRLKMKSDVLKSWSLGLADESCSPLLNPNAIHRERTLDMHIRDDCSLQENIAIGGTVERTKQKPKRSTMRDCSSPLQVLIPSFAFHRKEMGLNDAGSYKRCTPLGRLEKPPLPPSGTSKNARTVKFRFN
jgi:hypothetical protein